MERLGFDSPVVSILFPMLCPNFPPLTPGNKIQESTDISMASYPGLESALELIKFGAPTALPFSFQFVVSMTSACLTFKGKFYEGPKVSALNVGFKGIAITQVRQLIGFMTFHT